MFLPPCATRSNTCHFSQACCVPPTLPDASRLSQCPHPWLGAPLAAEELAIRTTGARGGLTPGLSASRAQLTPPAGQNTVGRSYLPLLPPPGSAQAGSTTGSFVRTIYVTVTRKLVRTGSGSDLWEGQNTARSEMGQAPLGTAQGTSTSPKRQKKELGTTPARAGRVCTAGQMGRWEEGVSGERGREAAER